MKDLILLVHTEEQVREACKRILGREGYVVDCLSEFSRISDAILENKPCLLLTAIRMGKKDGFQVLNEALGAAPNLPVIAITAHASIPGAVKFMKSGGINYLAAPFKADQLVDAVG